jgi:kinesin family protein 3/17
MLKRSKVNLCDLAGSEKINKAEEMAVDHFRELTNINLSLTTLGKVIALLATGKSSHIPFRESKLTRLLQDSFGGSTKTFLFATISPASGSIDETISTLKFADRAKNVLQRVR